MTKTSRWIQSTTAEVEASNVKLPWERGAHRKAFIASRRAVFKSARLSSAA